MKIKNIVVVGTAALLLVGAPAGAQDWSFEFEPYILASSIKGDAAIGRVGNVQIDVGFSDILEVLDIGFMGHFEAHNSNGWGVALDYGFMDLSGDVGLPLGGVVSADLRQGVFEGLLIKRRQSGDATIDYFAGVRWWDNEIGVVIDPAFLPPTQSFKVKEDWIDLIAGARWINAIDEKWKVQLRGDVGGFGLESDFTAALEAGFRYQMSKSIDLSLKYRALWVDFESGTAGQAGYFKYDTVTHGPIIGVVFRF